MVFLLVHWRGACLQLTEGKPLAAGTAHCVLSGIYWFLILFYLFTLW